jgi:hypothetical protein
MAKLSRNAIIGYPAGIIAGIVISVVAATFMITVTKR